MRRILPVLQIFTFCFLTTSCSLFQEASPELVIQLPELMLTVEDELVSSIRLQEGEGAILRYATPRSVATSLTSAIARKGKTVSLGGYFFGGFPANGNLSEQQLSWIADHLDVLALNPTYNGGVTPDDIQALKQSNPRLKFYSMLFATTMREPLFDPSTMSDWVVRNKNGKEALGVRRGYDQDTNHLMDLGNKDYAFFFRDFMIRHANQYHADGVAVDELMWNGYWGLDLHDMRDYTSIDQINQSCYDWLERVKTNNSKELIHQAFWSQSQRHTDGVWGETSFYSWFRNNAEYKVFYEELDYNEVVENLGVISKKNQTYIWAAFYDRDDVDQLEYSVATYLLGKNSNYAVFQPQPVYDGGYPNNLGGYDVNACIEEYEKHKRIFDVSLDDPIGEFYKTKVENRDIWVREFRNGMVFTNPNTN